MVRLVDASGGFAQGLVEVSIPVWCDWWKPETKVQTITEICFNSSMVRLVEDGGLYPDNLPNRFNSSMVRLVDHLCRIGCRYEKVSIPVWCDWWSLPVKSCIFTIPLVSIPVWCDWWLDLVCCIYSINHGFNSSMVRLVELALHWL